MTSETKKPFHVRLHEEAIAPNADKIARIFLDGDVALLFFEVGDGPEDMRAGAVEGARSMGWRGGRVEVGRMNKTRAARIADQIERTHPDDKAIGWLRRRSGNRVFVFAHVGTLCVDFVEGKGFDVARRDLRPRVDVMSARSNHAARSLTDDDAQALWDAMNCGADSKTWPLIKRRLLRSLGRERHDLTPLGLGALALHTFAALDDAFARLLRALAAEDLDAVYGSAYEVHDAACRAALLRTRGALVTASTLSCDTPCPELFSEELRCLIDARRRLDFETVAAVAKDIVYTADVNRPSEVAEVQS